MCIYPEKRDGHVTGRWRIEVNLPDQPRQRAIRATRFEAEEVEAAFFEGLPAPPPMPTPPKRPPRVPGSAVVTLGDLVEAARGKLWVGHRDAKGSWSRLEAFVDLIGDRRPLDDITTTYMDAVMVELRKGRTGSTVNRYRSALNMLLKWGLKRGFVTTLPHIDAQRENDEHTRWLSRDEEARMVAQLVAQGDDAVADLVVVLVDTGMRFGEALRLKPDDIDGEWARIWRPKNRQARSAYLSPRAREVLARRVPWVVSAWTCRAAWMAARKTLGLDHEREFTYRALRHTCATRLRRAQQRLETIQAFLGHRSIRSTLRYAHVERDELRRAWEAVESISEAAHMMTI